MKYSKTKIVVLCGGKGKRLGKITKKIPKPLVKVGKKSIMEHKLNYYSKQGFKDYIFCTGYKGNILKIFLKNKCKEPIFSNSGIKAGILKRLYNAKRHFNSPTILSYGDTLAKINLKDLLNKHKQSKALITIVVAPIRNPFGLVVWNKSGKVTNFNEKPILNHFIGYGVFEPNIFDFINKKIINKNDGEGIVLAIKKLAKRKLVNVYKFKGLQLTVNSQNELKNANLKFRKYFTFNEAF